MTAPAHTKAAETVDWAHTPKAETNRRQKAHRLACAARDLGLQPYDIQPIHAPAGADQQRARVRRLAGVTTDPSIETWQRVLIDLEGIARAQPGTTSCPLCGWPVLTVRTEAGKPLLIDPFPSAEGTVLPVATSSGPRARVLGASSPRPDDEPLYRQHATRCPERRRAAAPKAKAVPKCGVCRRPLNAELAASDPTYTTHPTCDPREGGAT